jgi:hypothetical protein
MITGTGASRFCATSISGVGGTTFEVSPASLLVGEGVENPGGDGILAERCVPLLRGQLRRVPQRRFGMLRLGIDGR